MDYKSLLEEKFHLYIDIEKISIERLKSESLDSDLSSSMHFIGSANEVFAIYYLYYDFDLNKAKKFFFNTARISEHLSIKFGSRVIDTGIYAISYALLSDNTVLIRHYSTLKDSINNDTSIGYQLPNAIQNILLENWDKLDWNIRCLDRLVKVKQFKWYASVIDILNGFKTKDKALIKNGLESLIETHSKRNKAPLISKFFSIDTAGFCKLAWIKGYEIDLKSPLVPAELMPITPLDHYPEYDFLKEGH